MVLLGGLEFVAAGYIINELHKDGKAAEKDERRHSNEHRKPRRRRDSRHRPDHGSQQLQLPSNGPQRPLSAPPPASRPMWQPQQPGPMPQMPQPQSQYYNQPPPLAMMQQHQQQHQSTPPPMYRPTPPPQPQSQQSNYHHQPTPPHPQAIHYPPPGQYIDLKTGKIQNNMYPPDMQPVLNNNGNGGASRDLSFDESRTPNPIRQSSTSSLPSPSPDYGPQQFHRNNSSDNGPPRPQVTRNQVSSPPLGYAELDAETPGRYRPYEKGSPQAFPSSGLGQRVMSMSSQPPPRSESGFYDGNGNGSVRSVKSPPPPYRV